MIGASNRRRQTRITWPSASLVGVYFLLVSPSGRCAEPIVACCRPNGSCDIALHTDCAEQGGDPQPTGLTCNDVACAPIAWAQASVFETTGNPACLRGWGAETLFGGAMVAADNFSLSAQTAVSAIHWWGMHLGWSSTAPPANDSPWFHIGIWSAETGTPKQPWDRPGTLLWQKTVRRSDLVETFVGCCPNSDDRPETSSAFRYDLSIVDAERFSSGGGGTYWISLAASQFNPGCECQGDVTAPNGSPDAADSAFISAHVGCPVGTGDSACDLCDIDCNGQVQPRDVAIGQCQVFSGWADPSCCVAPATNPWRWIVRPRETGPGAVKVLSPTALDIGSNYGAGEPLADSHGALWDLAFVLNGASGAQVVPAAPLPEPNVVDKNRYLTLVPSPAWAGHEIALRLRLVSLDRFPAFSGQTRWIAPPAMFSDNAVGSFHAAPAGCTPHFRDWTTIPRVHLYGSGVVPSSVYEIQAVDRSCENSLGEESCYSSALGVRTAKWGDVSFPFGGSSQPNFGDISAMVDKFKSLPTAIPRVQAQLRPNVVVPSDVISFLDVSVLVEAFKGRPYPFAGPDGCP